MGIAEFKARMEINDLDYSTHRRIQLKLKGLSPIEDRASPYMNSLDFEPDKKCSLF